MMIDLPVPQLRSRFELPAYGPVSSVLLCALLTNFLFVSGYDLQRCIELIALTVLAIVSVVRCLQGNRYSLTPVTLALIAGYFALGLVSVFGAQSLHHAFYEWSMFLLLLVLVFSVAGELDNEMRIHALIRWAGIACGLYSLRLLIMYAAALTSGYQMDMHTLAAGFGSARLLNHVQTPLLPLFIFLCLQAPSSGRWRKAWFVLATFWWALLFVCEARSSLLALSVGCAAAFALRRGHARRFMAMMMWTALAGLATYALLFIVLPLLAGLDPIGHPMSVVARTAANPSSNRNILWSHALQLIAAHPWFGIGPLHFAHVVSDLNTGAHPHNWLLQIGAEWGIPALLCALGAVFRGARALVRTGTRIAAQDTTNQQMLAMLLVGCTAILVDGLFSGVFVMPQSQLAIALVLSVACAWVRLLRGTVHQDFAPASILVHVVTAGLIAAASCALLWSVTPDLVRHARGSALTPSELANNPDVHWPRMWQAGFF